MAQPLSLQTTQYCGNTLDVHEASIALAILEEVSERCATGGIETIASVRIRVGALSSVVPEALRFAWDVATEGTLASGSELRIERVPLSIYCTPCGQERTIENSTLPICPVCSNSSNDIVHGRELLVTAMEVVYAAAPDRRSAEHSAQEHYTGA